jgi:hypothetical protein
MKLLLMTMLAAMMLTGCATQRAQGEPDASAEQDAKMARGLMDSMASAPHRFPANLPR